MCYFDSMKCLINCLCNEEEDLYTKFLVNFVVFVVFCWCFQLFTSILANTYDSGSTCSVASPSTTIVLWMKALELPEITHALQEIMKNAWMWGLLTDILFFYCRPDFVFLSLFWTQTYKFRNGFVYMLGPNTWMWWWHRRIWTKWSMIFLFS